MQTLKYDIRQRILSAGRREFSRKGFAKASMRSIAAESGVGTGNLYNYFSSKDQLFCSVLAPLTSSLYAILENHHGGAADALNMMQEEYMAYTVSEYQDLLRGNRTLMRILFFGAQGSSLENFRAEFADRSTEQVKKWFANNKDLYPQMNIRVSDIMIHLHTMWIFTLFEEILMRKIPDEEVPGIVEDYMRFEIWGWKHLLAI